MGPNSSWAERNAQLERLLSGALICQGRVGQLPSSRSIDCRSFLKAEKPIMNRVIPIKPHRELSNKGELVGQKSPPKLEDIWAIRVPGTISPGCNSIASYFRNPKLYGALGLLLHDKRSC